MSSCFTEVFDDILATASGQVFTGLHILRSPKELKIPSTDAHVAGLVGFTGEKLRGSLGVVSTFDVLAGMRPAELRQTKLSRHAARDWILVRDWAGELANQVLGRIKNRLWPFGVKFDIAAPVALSGRSLVFARPKEGRLRTLVLGNTEPVVWVMADTVNDPQLLSKRPDDAEGEAAHEGDVLIF